MNKATSTTLPFGHTFLKIIGIHDAPARHNNVRDSAAHCGKNGGSARSLRERAEWCSPSGDKKGRWAAG